MDGSQSTKNTLNGLTNMYANNITLVSDDVLPNRVLTTDADANVVSFDAITDTELSMLDGIDTDETIQEQIDAIEVITGKVII